jgi:type IV secretion system protein TrbB
LSAWNTGHSGGLATIHANDALNGLRRLETLVGGENERAHERIANAIDLVVFVDGESCLAAGRKVREVMVVRSFDPATQDYAVEYV